MQTFYAFCIFAKSINANVMSSLPLHTGPSSWDRDMQGLDESDESENLAALGMHIAGKNDDDDDEEEEEKEGEEGGVEKEVGKEPEAEVEEKKDEPEELDELKELERLEGEMKGEEGPEMMIDEEDT